MKLSRLIINNFRVFHGSHTFDFSKKQLIIIGGNNGHGKSSLFDAIQWCLTGEIRRYRGSSEYQNFNYIINENALNKNASLVEASVEVWLQTSDAMDHKIRRILQKKPSSHSTELIINEKSYGVKEGATIISKILFYAKDNDTALQPDQTKNLSSYFSSTQLLSQDQLHEFILASNPKDRFTLLEKVLSLDKYGGEFGKYLLESLQVIKGEKAQASKQKQEKKEAWVEVSTKLNEKEALLLKIGGVTEDDLVRLLISLTEEIKQTGVIVPEILNSNVNLDDETLTNYRKVRQNINNLNDHYERILLLLQESRNLFELTEENYSEKIKELKGKLQILNLKMDSRNNGIVRADRRRSEMDSLMEKRKAYSAKQVEYNEINSKILQVEQQILSIENNPHVLKAKNQYENTDNFMNIYKMSIKDLSKLTTQIEIKSLIRISHQLVEQINELTDSSKQLNVVKNEMLVNREKVSIELGILSEKIASSKDNSINQMIHDIQHFLLEQTTNNSCPICGNIFEDADKLHHAVLSTWEEANEQLSAFEQEVMKLTSQKNEIDRELDTTSKKITKINAELSEIKISYELNLLKIEEQKSTLEDWQDEFTPEELEDLRRKTEMILDEYSIAYNLIQSHEGLRSELIELNSERNIVTNWMKEQRKLVGTRLQYLLGSEEKIVNKIQIYDQYLLQAKAETEQIERDLKEITGQRVILEHTLNQQESKSKEIKELIPEFNKLQPQIEKWVGDFYKQKTELDRLNSSAEQLLEKAEAFLTKEEVALTKIEEKKLNEEVKTMEREIDHFENLEIEIESLRVRHNEIRSELMTDYLVGYSEVIDQLFMQISPHAIFKHVHLIPKDGKLYVLMSEKSGDAASWAKLSTEQLANKFNASLTFSSAQANVLAVCIFLSLALSQQWTALELIGIDDPFQNMDDINVFSFIDVISQIVSKKQVMISSHNDDFISLIKNKSALEAEKIGYIHFKSYSRDEIDLDSDCIPIS